MGKGSARRPGNAQAFENNYDNIFKKKKKSLELKDILIFDFNKAVKTYNTNSSAIAIHSCEELNGYIHLSGYFVNIEVCSPVFKAINLRVNGGMFYATIIIDDLSKIEKYKGKDVCFLVVAYVDGNDAENKTTLGISHIELAEVDKETNDVEIDDSLKIKLDW